MKANASLEAPAAVDPSGQWKIRWDRGFTSWRPSLFEGTLSLGRAGEGWTGDLSFDQSDAEFSFDSLRVDGDRLVAVFVDGDDHAEIELAAWLRDGRLVGEMRWGTSIPWTPFAGHPFEAEDEAAACRSRAADSVLARAAEGAPA